MKLLLLAFALTTATATDQPKQSVNLLLRKECLTAPVELIGCDLTVEPPRCKSTRISYKSSCAEVVISHDKPFTAYAPQEPVHGY